jgi:hypothetical protein
VDRTLKDLLDQDTLSELAQKLLAPSRDCNSQGAAFYRQTIYSLANKTELERVIEESMKDLVPAPAAQAQAAAELAGARPAHSASTSASGAVARASSNEAAARALLGSTKKEYQPALQDRSLVEALLALHKQKADQAARDRETARSAPAAPKAADPAAQAFAYVNVPQVEAAPKAGRHMSRTPGVSRSILRPRDSE